MNADLSLAVAGVSAEFILRTALGFAACLVLGRLIVAPTKRFLLWAGFLYGSAAYWLYLGITLLAGQHAVANAGALLAPSLPASPAAWQVPEAWAFRLSLAVGFLGLVYAATLAALLISHARRRRHLRWVLGFATQPPAEFADTLQSLARGLKIPCPRLLMLSGASSPATFGWLRPTILLPAVCLDQKDWELEDVLLHELHHVRRADSFWNTLGIVCRALLCFHPGAWYAMGKMHFNRELACDQAVISDSPARRGRYAESLLHFARLNMAEEPATWGIDFAAASQHLTIRVHSILRETVELSPRALWLRASSGFALLTALAVAVPFLGVLLTYTHSETPQRPFAAVPAVTQVRETRLSKKRRSPFQPSAASTPAGAPAVSQTESSRLGSGLQADGAAEERRPVATLPGPQLMHRSANELRGGARAQTITLVNDSDLSPNSKQKDGGQTVQSATAAVAIYKRLAALDRH